MKKLKKTLMLIIFIVGVLACNTNIYAVSNSEKIYQNYLYFELLLKIEIIACLVFWSVLTSIVVHSKKVNLTGYFITSGLIVSAGFIFDLIYTSNVLGSITQIDRFFYIFLLVGVVFGAVYENNIAKWGTVAMLTVIAGILQITSHASETMWIEYAVYVAAQLIFLPKYFVANENTEKELNVVQKTRKILIEVGDTVNLKGIDA